MLPGLQLLAKGLFPLGVFAAQCMLLFAVDCCLFGLFLFGLLAQRLQLCGNLLLALGQGRYFSGQLLFGCSKCQVQGLDLLNLFVHIHAVPP